MLRIDAEHYTMATRLNGERRPDEVVDAAYVHRYLDARTFFEGLGGREEHTRRPGGVLVVKATSPDGQDVRETIFTPTTQEHA